MVRVGSRPFANYFDQYAIIVHLQLRSGNGSLALYTRISFSIGSVPTFSTAAFGRTSIKSPEAMWQKFPSLNTEAHTLRRDTTTLDGGSGPSSLTAMAS